VADAKGRVKIAIRDLDQTVIGNPAHDLVRLGLSLATAIRGSDLPGVTTALMLEQIIFGLLVGIVMDVAFGFPEFGKKVLLLLARTAIVSRDITILYQFVPRSYIATAKSSPKLVAYLTHGLLGSRACNRRLILLGESVKR
jgi:hypothetical protein